MYVVFIYLFVIMLYCLMWVINWTLKWLNADIYSHILHFTVVKINVFCLYNSWGGEHNYVLSVFPSFGWSKQTGLYLKHTFFRVLSLKTKQGHKNYSQTLNRTEYTEKAVLTIHFLGIYCHHPNPLFYLCLSCMLLEPANMVEPS